MEKINEFFLQFNIFIHSPDTFIDALTHPSYLNENKASSSYQRLEFLGDSVLSLVVSTYLYTQLDSAPEGHLTDIRAALVRTETLAAVSRELHLDSYVRFSHGEEKTGRDNINILADVFEAIVGALYLDSGYGNASLFCEKTLLPKLGDILRSKSYIDPKTQLQELVQSTMHAPPQYRTISHRDDMFIVEVIIAGKAVAEGKGRSKKAAEQDAAKNAIALSPWK